MAYVSKRLDDVHKFVNRSRLNSQHDDSRDPYDHWIRERMFILAMDKMFV